MSASIGQLCEIQTQPSGIQVHSTTPELAPIWEMCFYSLKDKASSGQICLVNKPLCNNHGHQSHRVTTPGHSTGLRKTFLTLPPGFLESSSSLTAFPPYCLPHGGVNENGPYRLGGVSTWSLVGRTVCGVIKLEVSLWVEFGISKA